MNRVELHDELMRLKQEVSESCGLTEGDFEYRNALKSRIINIELQLYK